MVRWGDFARGIAIDLSKLLVSWVVEVNRLRSDSQPDEKSWICGKKREWLEQELDQYRELASRSLACEKALGQKSELGWGIFFSVFLCGVLVGAISVSFAFFVTKKSGRDTSVLGEPVQLVISPHEKKSSFVVKGNDLSRQEVAAARVRARKISAGPRPSSLEGDSELSAGQ